MEDLPHKTRTLPTRTTAIAAMLPKFDCRLESCRVSAISAGQLTHERLLGASVCARMRLERRLCQVKPRIVGQLAKHLKHLVHKLDLRILHGARIAVDEDADERRRVLHHCLLEDDRVGGRARRHAVCGRALLVLAIEQVTARRGQGAPHEETDGGDDLGKGLAVLEPEPEQTTLEDCERNKQQTVRSGERQQMAKLEQGFS
jgi:hypothetical protein